MNETNSIASETLILGDALFENNTLCITSGYSNLQFMSTSILLGFQLV